MKDTPPPNKKELGKLQNEYLGVSFVRVSKDGKKSARLALKINTEDGWKAVPVASSAESYKVLYESDAPPMKIVHHYQTRWKAVDAGKQYTNLIWEAGHQETAVIRDVVQKSKRCITIRFYPLKKGKLKATWELQPNAKSIRVSMHFTPNSDGQYSLGYFLFNSKPLNKVEELLMPMTVNRKRLPKKNYTMLQAQQPTPVSLMQTAFNGGSLTWGIAADSSEVPLEFPTPVKSRFGMQIKNPDGQVQPSIYGPLIGTPDAQLDSKEPHTFSFRLFVQNGNWYDAYRNIADNIFNWHDYRKNGKVSLTQAALNMIDLYKNDKYGGWWDRAKAPYQIESKNESTQASPLTALSLYCLTGDSIIYKERVLPSLEFILSRSGPHFSPKPKNTGHIPAGSMNGPVDIYGTQVYGALWEMTNYRTPAFKHIALPKSGVKESSGTGMPFDGWLGRYQLTGNNQALQKAVKKADAYIEKNIYDTPQKPRSLHNFFLISYIPKWQSLLNLYEATKKKRFLNAASFGAKMLMTGIWTQPTPEKGKITIHPNGTIRGAKMGNLFHFFWKGARKFRVGFPINEKNFHEKKVPIWLVSNAGLGFEQPFTYTNLHGGRMIFEAPWAPAFLRLARYTGNQEYKTYARNSVLGRWGNYPGYDYAAFNDFMQNSDYPYKGPDISSIYYHHIPAHLAWTIDYLISEAEYRSDGEVHFPSKRQFGYAYFDYLTYGQDPGKIMGEDNVWLWLRDDLVSLDNPQINYLTARSKGKFFVIMMNESKKQEQVKLSFSPKNIVQQHHTFESARIMSGEEKTLTLANNTAKVNLVPRGFKVLEISGIKTKAPAIQHSYQKPEVSSATQYATTQQATDSSEIKATSIQIMPGSWEAYVWSTAKSQLLERLTLHWSAGNKKKEIIDDNYPYEFSVPVSKGKKTFNFTVEGIKKDGTHFQTTKDSIGITE